MNDNFKIIAREAAKKIFTSSGCKSAPVDVVKIIKGLGIEYLEAEKIDDDLSGFIKRVGKDGHPVIVVNAEHSEHRQRFTAAHELGHYILHTMNNLFLDTAEEKVLFRKNNDTPIIDLKEIQANNFAAELLMPKDLLLKDIGEEIPTSSEAISQLSSRLAEKYNVSEQSMTIRLGGFLC
jgi:Zn-dependent peptidase ImmA (M78 family)